MRLRGTFVSAVLVLSTVPVVAGPVPFACAGEGPDATLVIDTGSSERFLCVALDSSSVSGIRLIQLAGEQHGFSYSLGYQGQAVCMLYGVGSEEEECFKGGQPFWGYWRANSSGGWTWSGTGAGGTSVEDGDVEGWSYGTGSDGNSHQAPPTTTHEAVCGPEPSETGGNEGGNPKPDKPRGGGDSGDRGNGTDKPNNGGRAKPGRGNDPPRAPGNGTSAPGNSGGGSVNEPVSGDESNESSKRKRSKDRGDRNARPARKTAAATPTTEPVVTPAPSPDVSPEAAPASGSTGDGPPLAGIAGLFVAILLGAAGAWFLKRKHAPTR